MFCSRQLVSTGSTWCRPGIITDTTITDHLAGAPNRKVCRYAGTSGDWKGPTWGVQFVDVNAN